MPRAEPSTDLTGARNLHTPGGMITNSKHAAVVTSLFLLLAGALAGCGEKADVAGEAAEIAAEGGTTQLRDSVRAPAGPPRVLVFALDGVGYNDMKAALDAGALPTLTSLLGEATGSGWAHGADAGPVMTVLPSITMAAWTTLFTGAPPGESGVPGNEWFDRQSDRFHAPAPVSVTSRDEALETMSDQLMDSLVAVPTLFDRADVRSYVALLPVHRGADLLVAPGATDLADLLGAFPRGAVSDEPVERKVYATVDRTSAEGMAELVRKEGPADLAVVYFPGIDLYTHAAPDPLAEQRRYLAEVTDSAIAEVIAAYREAGALEGTWVVVVADHGHTPVHNDAVHALAGDSAFSLGDALEGAGFRVRPPELDVEDGDHQAVMAWEGAFAYVSLADRSTCAAEGQGCAWPRPARWSEDILPAARAIERSAAAHPTRPIDLVLARHPNGGLRVIDDGEAVPLGQYLSAHPRPELLRFEERLGWLTTGPESDRSGDVIVMARLGASAPMGERFYFSHPYQSWHASAEAEDSYAPLLLIRTDRTGPEVRDQLKALGDSPTQLDFTPLMLSLLGREP